MSLRIEIRDPRLKRLSLQAGTTNAKERDRIRASLLQLVETERGRAILEKLRARKLKLRQVHEAVQSLDLTSLEDAAKAKEGPAIGLGATIDGWLEWLHGADRSPQTIAFYRSIANNLEAHFGVVRDHGEIVTDRAIADISRTDGETWLAETKAYTGKAWAPRTQTVAHSLAAQIWDRAIAVDEERAEKLGTPRTIPRNFWRREGSRKGVRAARIRRTRVEFLQRKDAARLLRKNKHLPQAAWIAIGIYAGLRGGEASNLRLGQDVNLKEGTIKIQSREGQYAWRTKTDNSQRTVPIHPRLARWLRAHVKEGWSGQTYLFRQPGKDRPLTRSAWRWWTKTAFERAGIRYGRKQDALVFHSLRHTTASWLTMADVHPLKISKLLGDTVEMVIKTYSHLIDKDLEEAIRRL